jgi:hypothetical protein
MRIRFVQPTIEGLNRRIGKGHHTSKGWAVILVPRATLVKGLWRILYFLRANEGYLHEGLAYLLAGHELASLNFEHTGTPGINLNIKGVWN